MKRGRRTRSSHGKQQPRAILLHHTCTQTHIRICIPPFTRHRAIHNARGEKTYVHSTGAVYHSVQQSADLKRTDTVAKVRRDGRKHEEDTSTWGCGRTSTRNLFTSRTTVSPHGSNLHAAWRGRRRQKLHEYPQHHQPLTRRRTQTHQENETKRQVRTPLLCRAPEAGGGPSAKVRKRATRLLQATQAADSNSIC